VDVTYFCGFFFYTFSSIPCGCNLNGFLRIFFYTFYIGDIFFHVFNFSEHFKSCDVRLHIITDDSECAPAEYSGRILRQNTPAEFTLFPFRYFFCESLILSFYADEKSYYDGVRIILSRARAKSASYVTVYSCHLLFLKLIISLAKPSIYRPPSSRLSRRTSFRGTVLNCRSLKRPYLVNFYVVSRNRLKLQIVEETVPRGFFRDLTRETIILRPMGQKCILCYSLIDEFHVIALVQHLTSSA
jgi:hypothetical protein